MSSLADIYSKASSVIADDEKIRESRRKRASEQSIQDLYSSGQPVDQASIQRLLASGADPASVLSISKLMRGDRVDDARILNLKSQMKVRESPMVAGAIKKAFDAFKAKPPEQQTQMEWEKWKQTGRSMLASNGIDPELIPADADPQMMEMQIGAGYSPGAQDLTQDRQAEMGARQGRFETAQAGMDARSDARIGAANQRASLGRTAVTEREKNKGTPSPKQTQFDRDMAQLTPEEAKKALLVKYKLEKAPGEAPGSRPLQTQNLKNVQKYRELESNTQQLIDAADSLDADIAKQGTETDIPIMGSAGASVQKTRYADVMSGIQKIREMGVLQPGEFPFLEMAVKNPTTFMNALQGDNVRAQLAELKAQAGRAMKRAETRFLQDPAAPPGATPSRSAQGQPQVAGAAPSLEDIEAEIQRRRGMAGR